MIAEQYVGMTFRQWALELRIVKDKAAPSDPTVQRISARPYDPDSDIYLDSDEAPTLVTFDADDNVDVDFLLRIGAVAQVGSLAAPAPDPTAGPASESDFDGPAPKALAGPRRATDG